MPNQWGVSPLGNLSEFPVPQFHTGEGLGAILALKQRQQEHIQDSLTGAAESIAKQMERQKRDKMANALMDQYATDLGIDPVNNPFAGQGERGLSMVQQLIKTKEAAQDVQRYDVEGYPVTAGQALLAKIARERIADSGSDLTANQQLMQQNRELARQEREANREQSRRDSLERRRSDLLVAAENERIKNTQLGEEAAGEQPGFVVPWERENVIKARAEKAKPFTAKPFSREKELTRIETELGQMEGGGSTQKEVTPDIAAALLKQAGGDKEKARELARQAGYTF